MISMRSGSGFRTVLTAALVFSSIFASVSFGQNALRPTPRSAIANPTKFARIPVSDPYDCEQSISRCARKVLARLGADGPQSIPRNSSREEVFTFGNGVVIYLLTIGGLEDDAIEAERYRVAFKQAGDTLQLVQVGRQQKCARGTPRWTKASCP